MEKETIEKFNDEILNKALQRYGIGANDYQLLDGFESFIYAFTRRDKDYILRIGHSNRRSEAMILGEIDWIQYLSRGGAGVARAIASLDGKFVEPIKDDHNGYFLATAFRRAPGLPPWEFGWSEQLYEVYGALLGRMHALSQSYTPTIQGTFRPQWYDNLVLDVANNLPESERDVLRHFERCVDDVSQLPQTLDWYGMVHFDAHAGNFYVDERGSITLFDFDDCHYDWYAYDIAIVLFYKVMGAKDQAAYTHEFMRPFMRGYQRENTFNPEWLMMIPVFLKMREIDLYAVIHRDFDVDNLTDPWNNAYMDGRKARILAEIPYIDLEFATLRQYIL